MTLLEFDPGGIPEELAQCSQWLAWKLKPPAKPGSKPRKVPINAHTGRYAKYTNPSSWGTLAQALAIAQRRNLPGVGFVFSANDPYVGIDLDDVVHDGQISADAQCIVERFATYTEPSCSGTGLHLILKADAFPEGWCKHLDWIETYHQKRFFVVTGRPLPGYTVIADRTADFLAWRAELTASKGQASARAEQVPRVTNSVVPTAIAVADDQDLVMCCRKLSDEFAQLFDYGDCSAYGNDHSSADLALLNYFVKAGATDRDQLDRLFRTSALMRDKWDRDDYRDRTIARALDGVVVAGDSTETEIAQLKRRVAGLERKLDRRAQTEQSLREMISCSAKIRRNKTLKNTGDVGWTLAIKFEHFESMGASRPYPLSIKEIAADSGMSRNTAPTHLEKLEKAGLLRHTKRYVPEHVDPETGEIVPAKTTTFLEPLTSAAQFAADLAALDLSTNWGGARPTVPVTTLDMRLTPTIRLVSIGGLLPETVDRSHIRNFVLPAPRSEIGAGDEDLNTSLRSTG